jgi:ectoine hydroxylase-related dioxygenase (phytanoyl-CoA dioxygenase family)
MAMDVQQLTAEFGENGYLVLDDFFDAELMDRLDERILCHFGDDPDFRHQEEFLDKSKTEVIPWFPQQEGVHDFDAVEHHPVLEGLTRSILGDQWERLYCMVMFSKRGTRGQAWHQDCPPEDPAVFNLNRLVYTRDISDDTGGETVIVPGSHRRGLLPAGDPTGDFPGRVVIRPRKGTLVLLHGHAWHRVLPIRGKFRFSANYRAAPHGHTPDITDVCVYRNMRYRFSTSSVIEERLLPA